MTRQYIGMKMQIALLRGVNLGSRKVVMSELRAVCEAAGCSEARTLLASGNVVVNAKLAGEKLERKLEEAIAAQLGLETDVFVRAAAELEDVVAANPFADFARKDPSHLQVYFLREAPGAAERKAVEAPQEGPEEASVAGRQVYVTFPEGIGRSKWKLKLKQSSTARNWNTVVKLAGMANEMARRQ
jgi:uncharacterized protein (DUF1697 family)